MSTMGFFGVGKITSVKWSFMTSFFSEEDEVSEVTSAYLARVSFADDTAPGCRFPRVFYYVTLSVGSAGGGNFAMFGEVLSVYGGASPSDESLEPLFLAS